MQVLLPQILPRAEYSIKLIFTDILGVDIEIITNPQKARNNCLVYGGKPVKNLPFLFADSIIQENDISAKNPQVFFWDNIPVFFASSANSIIPFDIFSATFWCASRYEEYSNFVPDKLERFTAQNSHAFRNNYLNKPIINIWANKFALELKKVFPDLKIDKPKFRYIPTIDIDSLFMYKHKGFARTIGASLRDIFNGDVRNFKKRFNVLTNKDKDPWDCINDIINLHTKQKEQLKVFILLSKYGKYDKASGIHTNYFIQQFKSLFEVTNIGIHPGMSGHSDFKIWDAEFELFKSLFGAKAVLSRMHYLKLNLPGTYEYLLNKGIIEDYSMAYPDTPGFRAGTSTPFYFFNLKTNKQENLKLYPTAVMDVSLKNSLKFSGQEALEYLINIYNKTKAAGGMFISLWHNESFSGYGEWQGWDKVYYDFIKYLNNNAD
ncbi:MAG TPA: hypothetical protein P5509_02965 [Bacteroidales bacterium]|nr:hypothetical protein [Bacteroidales bacterium]